MSPFWKKRKYKKKSKLPIKPKARKKKIKVYKKIYGKKEKLLVSHFMTRDLICVDENSTLDKVAELFISKNISGAPVLSKGKLVGEISKTDLLKIAGGEDLKAITPEGMEKLSKVIVKEVMKKPICISENASIEEAKKKMEKYRIRRLLVLDKNKKLVGIITTTDLAKGISKEKIKEEISTAIDEMLRILEKKGSMRIDEISKQLKVPPELVEEWAKILEESGLIKLEYPTFGKPILRWIKTKVI